MTTLKDWILEGAQGEPVIAVIIGEMGWSDYNEPEGISYKPIIGKVLSWDDALPYISYEFDDGYGAPRCNAIIAYTQTWAISVSQYDGSTTPFVIPRNPIDGFIPEMPGG